MTQAYSIAQEQMARRRPVLEAEREARRVADEAEKGARRGGKKTPAPDAGESPDRGAPDQPDAGDAPRP
jgi:hypothetical protein